MASSQLPSSPIVVPESSQSVYPEDKPFFYVGHHEANRTLQNADYVLQEAQDVGYDFITAPLSTPHFRSRTLQILSEMTSLKAITETDKPSIGRLPIIPPFEADDTQLLPGDSVAQLVGYCSTWIDICSADPLVASISRQVLTMEIAYAAFCGVGNIVIPGPRLHNYGRDATDGLTRYARVVQEALDINSYIQIAIHLPMYEGQESHIKQDVGDLSKFSREKFMSEDRSQKFEEAEFATWDTWNMIRTICKYNARLSIALELPLQQPSSALQSRWFAEPLRMLSLTPSTFPKNKGGHPCLSKHQQALIFRYMKLKRAPWLLLCHVGPVSPATSVTPPTPAEAESSRQEPIAPYLTYMRYLHNRQPARTMIEGFSQGYQDYLQAPLQPLTDNLESATYEVFEKDPVKYDQYELAITEALKDWRELKKPTSGAKGKVVVAVAGAGRGPLVTRALLASSKTGVEIEMWAVEKNPNAYVVLQMHNRDDWDGHVHIVKSDMRAWKGPLKEIRAEGETTSKFEYTKVDILISELLGSFADNELSPECLDGVQNVLAANHGISIPATYTAHCTPVLAPRLHAEIWRRGITDPTAVDTPYVVLLQQIDFAAVSVPSFPRFQEAWEFRHPVPNDIMNASSQRRMGGVSGGGGGSMVGGDGANEHNSRYARMKFVCKDRTALHGIAGYFESVLYESREGAVELSTRPDTIDFKSKDMMSWFPIYFPLKNPLYAPDDSELEVSFWRQTDDRKVWYEWMIEVFVMTGPSQRIRVGSSEVGSSRKTGYLM